jgi:large subunit ribosomal protein L33
LGHYDVKEENLRKAIEEYNERFFCHLENLESIQRIRTEESQLVAGSYCRVATTLEKESEVEVVRVRITLACTECKQRNYNTTKDKKTHPDRMETKKYCRFCRTHTLHKETK